MGTHPSVTSKWPCTNTWSCGNTSHSHIRMALSPRPSIPSKWLGTSIPRMTIALISNQVGTHPSITSEWPCTHIWSCENTSHSHIRMALSPRLSFPGNWQGVRTLQQTSNQNTWYSSRTQNHFYINRRPLRGGNLRWASSIQNNFTVNSLASTHTYILKIGANTMGQNHGPI